MSLTQVAAIVGVTKQAVSKWELGKSRPTDRHRLQLDAVYDEVGEGATSREEADPPPPP